MHIAFSAFQQPPKGNNIQNAPGTLIEHEVLQRFEGYRIACEKHKDEIAAIQKYIPGWQPAFNR